MGITKLLRRVVDSDMKLIDSVNKNELYERDNYYLNIIKEKGKNLFCYEYTREKRVINSQVISPSRNEIIFVKNHFGGRETLEVLKYTTKKKIFSINFKESYRFLRLSPFGREIMLPEGDGKLTVLDLKTGKEILSKQFEKLIDFLSFSPSGEKIMLMEGGKKLIILDSKTGEKIFFKNNAEGFFNPVFGVSDEMIILYRGKDVESYEIKYLRNRQPPQKGLFL